MGRISKPRATHLIDPQIKASAETCLYQVKRCRKENVERGFEVQNVKIEPLKKLVIPLNKFSEEDLEECRELAGDVVDLESEPEFWEVYH